MSWSDKCEIEATARLQEGDDMFRDADSGHNVGVSIVAASLMIVAGAILQVAAAAWSAGDALHNRNDIER